MHLRRAPEASGAMYRRRCGTRLRTATRESPCPPRAGGRFLSGCCPCPFSQGPHMCGFVFGSVPGVSVCFMARCSSFGRTSVGESELGPASSAKTTTTGPNLVVYGQIQPAGWVVRGGIVVDEEGRGRKACPNGDQMFVPRVARAVHPQILGARLVSRAIKECSAVLSMHSPRAQTLARSHNRSHTRPPKEEQREEELLAPYESRMERNESRSDKQ